MLFIFFLGLLIAEAAVHFASIGETVHIKCPYKMVYIWQKLETSFIFASCEKGLPVINSTISNRISFSDSCDDFTIENFTKKDVGIYRCYVIRDTKQYKYEVNITLQSEQT